MKHFMFLVAVCAASGTARGQAFNNFNYPGRRAIIADICPAVKVESFQFGNQTSGDSDQFDQHFGWSNRGDKDVIAIEFVTLKYDPFDEPLIGSRATFPGHNSAMYNPLKPGEKDSDGEFTYGSEETFTAIFYVRAVRFADGSIWKASSADLLKSIKTQAPDIVDPGPLAPPLKEKSKPGAG